jgi:hypothetical protein
MHEKYQIINLQKESNVVVVVVVGKNTRAKNQKIENGGGDTQRREGVA